MNKLVCALLLTTALSACSSAPKLLDRPATDQNDSFSAKAIVAVSDLDMAGTGYADARMRQIPGQADALSIVRDLNLPSPNIAATRVSNSVTGWPGPIALSADNRFAYVIETQGEIEDSIDKVENPYSGSPGTYLTTVNISDLSAPVVVSRTEIGANPTAIAFIAGGKALAISRRDDAEPLAIVTLKDGAPVSTKYFAFPASVKGPRPTDKGIPYLTANADGTMLALNLAYSHIAFAKVELAASGDVTAISAVGAPVAVGKWLSMGRFSSDSRFFIATDTGWGPGRYDAVLNTSGSLTSIAIAADGQHSIASKLTTSLSPKGIDFSADGTRIAVANMERTYLPSGLPYELFGRRNRYSLSLVGFDAGTGKLTMIDGPVGFEGVLPEDVVFDDAGKMLAVAVYHERGDAPKAGWIELVSVIGDKITPTGKRIALPRGVHDLAVIRNTPAVAK
jgi:DNA-binding beta-propeller fold protein YncE